MYFCTVIELDKHIEILLLSNDCVIVPGFGGFTASHVPARYDKADNMFLPPSRTLGFNQKLNLNDSLLVQSYSEAYEISYPEAYSKIESEVNELRQHLNNDGCYELTDIGTLYQTEYGIIEFSPCEAGLLTPQLYSLSSFEMNKLSLEVQDVEQKKVENSTKTLSIAAFDESKADNKGTESHSTYIKKRKPLKSSSLILRNAVAVIITIIVYMTLSNPVNKNIGSKTTMSNFDTGIIHNLIDNGYKNIKRDKRINLISTETAKDVNNKKDQIKAEKKAVNDSLFYCIVLASKITDSNAKVFIDKLKNQGFNKATLLNEKGKSLKVIYGHYATKSEAYNALNEYKANENFYEAWIYKVTNKDEKGKMS